MHPSIGREVDIQLSKSGNGGGSFRAGIIITLLVKINTNVKLFNGRVRTADRSGVWNDDRMVEGWSAVRTLQDSSGYSVGRSGRTFQVWIFKGMTPPSAIFCEPSGSQGQSVRRVLWTLPTTRFRWKGSCGPQSGPYKTADATLLASECDDRERLPRPRSDLDLQVRVPRLD